MSQANTILAVEAITGHFFTDQDLVWDALHAAGTFYGRQYDNKTLAKLGDVVVRLVLLDDLITTGASREEIDRTISRMASDDNLAEVCTRTGLAVYITGHPSHVGEQSPKTKKATIEAMLAAVYLDSDRNIYAVRYVMSQLGLHAPDLDDIAG